jgi:Cu(I)/Ag(I) efflux system membrane fusion protein
MRRLLVIRRLNRRNVLIAAAALAALALGIAGYAIFGGKDGTGASNAAPCPTGEPLYWYDPMVPAQHFDAAGKSPFMDMQLVAKCPGEQGEGVRVSSAMQQNLGVRLAEVQVRDLAPTVQVVGRVELDERLIAEVQTLTAGFIEQLAVRAEGEPVRRGSRIASVYSPELLTAQNEYKALLQARSAVSADLRGAARSRLRLLGMPEAMVRRLERGGAPQRTYPVYAPASGFVQTIGARLGAQVQPGQSIVTIAGISRVWVVAEVPEARLGDVRVGLPVEVSFPAYPGETREGRVDYIYPALDPDSRTARVRITLANPRDRLKEGMFANVTIQGTGGMALVVPSEAVIDTGRRKVVIVQRNGAFVPAEVTTGRDVDEWTQILSGVQRGDQVVASGQFLIDSEASLSGVLDRLESNAPRNAPELALATGRIRSLDTAAGKVTIAHGPVPTMNWPPMTMTFAVRKPALLRGLTKGDRVEFGFQPRQQGQDYVIERIAEAAE